MESTLVLSKSQRAYHDIFWVLFASLLISLCFFIQITLFFTPVPLVIQNAVAVAIGALLGSKKGIFAVILFLAYGCLNLPVFAVGTVSYTGGYLLGYCAAAFITGKILENFPSSLLLSILAGHLTILVCGTCFLALTIGLKQAFCLGFIPFVVPDILKAIILFKMLAPLNKR